MWNLIYLFTGFIFIVLLDINFFSKKRINTKENKMFRILSLINLFTYIIEIFLQIIVRMSGVDNIYVDIFAKLYIIFIFLWFTIFSIYTFLISYSKDVDNGTYKFIKSLHIMITFLGVLLITVFPMEKYYASGKMYSYGLSVDFLKIMLGIYVAVWIIRLLLKFKTIREKKYYPIIVTILMLFLNIIVQTINPSILIATFTMTYTCYIIYFTIENPDIKLIKELEYSKEVAIKSKNETINILNGMTNDLKKPLEKLISIGYEKIDKKDIDEVYNEIKYVQRFSIDLADKITGAIDIAKIENSEYRIESKKYDTYEMLNDLKYFLSLKKGQKNVTVTTDIADNITKVLYGDSEKIQQTLLYALDFFIEIINNGNINIKIDSAKSRNFCRLRFHFFIDNPIIKEYIDYSRSHKIFPLYCKKINYRILFETFGLEESNNAPLPYISNKEINCQIIFELLKKLHGKTIIPNTNSSTTEIIIGIDQRIIPEYDLESVVKTEEDKIVKYFNANNKRVLIIDDNNYKIKELIRMLKPYKLNIDVATNYEELTNLKFSKKVFDLIIVDDIIPDIIYNLKNDNQNDFDGVVNLSKDILDNLQYEVPILIMVTENLEHYEDKYLKSGISDFILKPINKYELNKKITKYLKNKSD